MARQQTLKRGMRIHMMEKQTWEALYALKMLYELTFLSSFWKCAICAILQVMDTQSNRHDEMGAQPNEILATVTQYPKGVRGDKDLSEEHLLFVFCFLCFPYGLKTRGNLA